MLFVFDTGNTNTVLGVFKDNELLYEWRIKTDPYKTEDEFGILLQSLFNHKGISFSDFKGVIISSVVPPMVMSLEKMCQRYFDLEPLIIGHKDVKTFLPMRYPHPEEVGADRIVNAVGAIEKYGGPMIIIDFGTATTFCYINEDEEYTGGLITPGIKISMEALYRSASKLPKIELQAPDNIVGESTVEAMQSGVFYGYIGQVDGIIKRIKKEKKVNVKVIATGGLAPLIANESETIDYVDPHLTLNGLYFIYRMNQKNKGDNEQ